MEGVKCIDKIQTRMHVNKIYVDVEIAVDENLSVKDGHLIAHEVHDLLEYKFKNIKHCMVHINPY